VCAVGVVLMVGQIVVPAAALAGRLPRPTILSVGFLPGGRIVAVGDRVDVVLRVRGATKCSFFAQHAPFSRLYPVRTVRCDSGRARVTMPVVKNPYGHTAKLLYRVRAQGAGGTAVRTFRITAAGSVKEPAPPPLPSPPPAPAGVASAIDGSSNWAGYALTVGPYTSVSGTFNVPAVAPSDPGGVASEWVGIDGLKNTSLIQAGVAEGGTTTFAWWEILPNPPTSIPVPVTPGDQITVSISQASSTSWHIAVTDDTTAQTFATDQPYTGPGASAEWIVEAPSAGIGLQYPLAVFSPAVTFTSLAFAGPENTLTELVMRQGRKIVAMPSVPSATGFSVAYGATAPPAP
jgi:hypothetical protein